MDGERVCCLVHLNLEGGGMRLPFPGDGVVVHQIVGGHFDDAGAVCIPLCNQVVEGLGVGQNGGVPDAAHGAADKVLVGVGLGDGLGQQLRVGAGVDGLNLIHGKFLLLLAGKEAHAGKGEHEQNNSFHSIYFPTFGSGSSMRGRGGGFIASIDKPCQLLCS